MAVRVGWLLSGLAVVAAAVVSLAGYLELEQLDVASDRGMGPTGVWVYLFVPALVVIWVGVLVAALVMRIPPGFDHSS